MIKLDNVTLLGIDCVNIERLILASEICQEQFSFAKVKLLTSLASENKNVVKIKPIKSIAAYSRFCIKDLVDYVDTDYVLIIQYDGFILNPKAWDDVFLEYDYIGAPWFVKDWSVKNFHFPKSLLGKMVVGNGGFSLRSKKFLQVCSVLAKERIIKTFQPEDVAFCVWHRKEMEKHGISFAPVEIAKKFSFESLTDEHDKWDDQFGFHGFRWTDISKWTKKHPQYNVDTKLNTIKYSKKQE